MKKICVQLFSFLLLSAAILRAQDSTSTIQFDRIPSELGLSQNLISAILQDHKGFLWFGSNGNGLFKYDSKVAPFSRPHRGAAKLSLWRGTSIRSLCETRDPAMVANLVGVWVIWAPACRRSFRSRSFPATPSNCERARAK